MKSIALACSPEGVILKVIRNDFGLPHRIGPGRPFLMLFDKDSLAKASRFMSAVNGRQAAIGWELTVGEILQTLHFCGGRHEGGIFIIGAGSTEGATRLLEEMMHISNEQTNALRAALKEAAVMRERAERDSSMYDALTRLNNELTNLQRRLSKQNTELARLNAQKNTFFGMAAHDLHHPLWLIQTYSEFLLEEAAADLAPTHREFLDVIRSSSETLHRMISDYLDIATIESGRLRLRRRGVDLTDLIRRFVARQSPLVKKQGGRLRLSLPAAVVTVHADPDKFEQVLSNLISNAVKYSADGAIVGIGLALLGNEAVLTVQDNGVGIPEAMMGKLFMPFERLPTAAKMAEKSSGLGLAIVKKIVEGHGWRIDVKSEEGAGSVFSVTMPVHRDGGGHAARAAEVPEDSR